MPGQMGRIYAEIWTNKDFTSLPHSAQWLYFTLLAQSDINAAGVVTTTARKLSRSASDVDTERIEFLLLVLDAAAFVVYDDETEEILVRTYVRNDGIASMPNQLFSACKHARLIVSQRLQAALAVELSKLDPADLAKRYRHRGSEYRPIGPVVTEIIELLRERSGSAVYTPRPYPLTPPHTPSGNPSGNPFPNPSAKGYPPGTLPAATNGVAQASDQEERSEGETLSQTLPGTHRETRRGRGRGSTSVFQDPATSEQAVDHGDVDLQSSATVADPAMIDTMIDRWTADQRASGRPVPRGVITTARREALKLAAEGFSAARIQVALALWVASGLGSTQIPALMNDVINGPDALMLDPDRPYTNREIMEIRGGHVPDPTPDGWWRDVAAPEARRLAARGRTKIIAARRDRTR